MKNLIKKNNYNDICYNYSDVFDSNCNRNTFILDVAQWNVYVDNAYTFFYHTNYFKNNIGI